MQATYEMLILFFLFLFPNGHLTLYGLRYCPSSISLSTNILETDCGSLHLPQLNSTSLLLTPPHWTIILKIESGYKLWKYLLDSLQYMRCWEKPFSAVWCLSIKSGCQSRCFLRCSILCIVDDKQSRTAYYYSPGN